MKIILVYNKSSGGAFSQDQLTALFAKKQMTVIKALSVREATSGGLSPYIKKDAIIAAVGGDGTISAVAGLLAGSEAILMPLPGGTLNHFTKDLRVPQDMAEAISYFSASRPRAIDVASVNGVTFINNSSIGVYPTTLHARARIEDKLGKWPAAIVANLHAFARLRTYTVTINGKTIATPFIFVGNNNYDLQGVGGPARENINKGVLSVFIAKTSSRLVFLKLAFFAFIGKAHALDELKIYHASSLTIRTRHRRFSVSHDGEVSKLSSPLHYESKPRTLRILR